MIEADGVGKLFHSLELPPNLELRWTWDEHTQSFSYSIGLKCTDIRDRKTPIQVWMDREIGLAMIQSAHDGPLERIQRAVANLATRMLEHELHEWLTVGGEGTGDWFDLGENHRAPR